MARRRRGSLASRIRKVNRAVFRQQVAARWAKIQLAAQVRFVNS